MADFDELDDWHKNPGGPFPPWVIWVIVIAAFGLLCLGMRS